MFKLFSIYRMVVWPVAMQDGSLPTGRGRQLIREYTRSRSCREVRQTFSIKGSFTLCDFFWLRLQFVFVCDGLHRSWWCCRSRIVCVPHIFGDKKNRSGNQKKLQSMNEPSRPVTTVRFFWLQLRFLLSQLLGCTELNGRVHTMWKWQPHPASTRPIVSKTKSQSQIAQREWSLKDLSHLFQDN